MSASGLVVVPEWRTASGRPAAFCVSELTEAEYDDYQQEGEGSDFTMTLVTRRRVERLARIDAGQTAV